MSWRVVNMKSAVVLSVPILDRLTAMSVQIVHYQVDLTMGIGISYHIEKPGKIRLLAGRITPAQYFTCSNIETGH